MGGVRVAILAMDVLDFRGFDNSFAAQMELECLHRDLNKVLAAYSPVDEHSLKLFETFATGNWGSGAFGGCAHLKAVVQWAAASQSRRQIRYFPFNMTFGPEFQRMTNTLVRNGNTTGDLVTALHKLHHYARANHSEIEKLLDATSFFDKLSEMV